MTYRDNTALAVLRDAIDILSRLELLLSSAETPLDRAAALSSSICQLVGAGYLDLAEKLANALDTEVA